MSLSSIKLDRFDGEDVDDWIEQFQAFAESNDWDEKQQFKRMPLFFSGKASRWFQNSKDDIKDLSSLIDELRQRFQVTLNKKQLWSKLNNMKRKESEDLRDYIDKFNEVKRKYEGSFKDKAKVPVDDSDYCEIFVAGLRPRSVRDKVEDKEPETLKQAMALAVKYEAKRKDRFKRGNPGHSNDDDTSDDQESDEAPVKITPEGYRQSDTNSDDSSLLKSLAARFERMELLVEERLSVPVAASGVNRSCYNCRQSGHQAKECNEPCKICKGSMTPPNHAFFNCPKYVPKRRGELEVKKEDSMHAVQVEGDSRQVYVLLDSDNEDNFADDEYVEESFAAKRQRSVSDNNATKQPVQEGYKKIRVQDILNPSAPAPMEVTPQEQNLPKPQRVMPAVNTPDPAVVKRVVNKRKKKPEDKSSDQWEVGKILGQKAITVSVQELADWSPKFRSEAKKYLTKPRRDMAPMVAMPAYKHEETLKAPEKNSGASPGAPRLNVKVNGMSVAAVLDGGSTSCLVSLQLIRDLGITELEESNTTHLMADGTKTPAVGEVRGLVLQLGSPDTGASVRVQVDATVFHQTDYPILLGRRLFEFLGVGTDWKTGFWYLRVKDTIVPLPIYYLHDAVVMDVSDSGDGSSSIIESSYLVIAELNENVSTLTEPVLLNETLGDGLPTPQEEIRGDLINNIKSNSTHLSLAQQEQLIDVLTSHLDAFGKTYQDLTQTDLLEFHVNTGEALPIAKRPNYWMSHEERELLRNEINEMVSQGILIPAMHNKNSKGTWAFPVMYVKKKTGDKRLVTQFQSLNEVTAVDSWPIPLLTDLLEAFVGANWFSTVDMLKGFNQIKVAPDSVEKLTITTPWGLYSYRVMPFGVKNGPSTFARAIYLALQQFIPEQVVAYMDDVTVFSSDFERHLLILGDILKRMIDVKFKLKPDKCRFAAKEVELLGYLVSPEGVRPNPKKVQAILEFPRPKNHRDIRAFVNLAGFFRRHINQFSAISAPLTGLLKKGVPFRWDQEHETSFLSLKAALKDAACLAFPDPRLPYNAYTDASDKGIGACLTQVIEGQGERPVCFLSRKLKVPEVKYATVEKELLAVYYALVKFRKYLIDKEFHLYTDNSAVRWLLKKSDPSSRLQRWIIAVQEFSYCVHHLPGKTNIVADVLSRYPPNNSVDASTDTEESMFVIEIDVDYEKYLEEVFLYLVTADQQVDKKIKNRSLKYVVVENKLYRKIGRGSEARLVLVPKRGEREAVIKQCHDGHGHFGCDSTWSRMYVNYWWPSAYQDVKDYVSTCYQCQINSSVPPRYAPGKIDVFHLFERFGLDYVGPLPTSSSGNKYIIVAMEYYTKWPVARATKKADAASAVLFVYEEIICHYGPPKVLLTDGGKHFDNKFIDQLSSFVNTKHHFAAPYHPETNGLVERFNGTLIKAIKKLCIEEPQKWDQHLQAVIYAYRTRAHSTLKISPYELLYGMAPSDIVPGDRDMIKQWGNRLGFERLYYLQSRNISDLDHAESVKYDKMPNKNKECMFNVGDIVLRVRRLKMNKLESNFQHKPFVVTGVFGLTVSLCDLNGKPLRRRINVQDLILFKFRRH
ncbi:hypothetical protein G6F61_009915 [Rhizopus arrhizus]|nr:hypothetical protein G6F42_012968 [Rhizopus arrhizus]KAG1373752.1 hypothetical protein G6F61_009915 [Rhizopus arrhizus]